MSKVRSVKRQIDAKRQDKAKAKRERRQGGARPEEEIDRGALAPVTRRSSSAPSGRHRPLRGGRAGLRRVRGNQERAVRPAEAVARAGRSARRSPAEAREDDSPTVAAMTRRLLFNAFSMNCVSHIQHGLWARDDTRQRSTPTSTPGSSWRRLLERGNFDALFLADVVGTYDTYRGGREASVTEACRSGQRPDAADPGDGGTPTEHLGFAVHQLGAADPPVHLRPPVSTLDHLTGGRVAWNIVTSYLPKRRPQPRLRRAAAHDDRYDAADEYLEVLYKLWEAQLGRRRGVGDRERRHYADPAKVHDIDHVGEHYPASRPAPLRAVAATHAAAVPGRLSDRARVRRPSRGVPSSSRRP